jgi:AraC-like DNA-binding protein/mannose-6-phosphate isomerase-like protein (cupin superfamily)
MAIVTLEFRTFERKHSYHAALITIRPGRPAGLVHDHKDFAEIMLVLRGSGIHDANGMQRPVRAGHVVVIRPDDRHVVRGDLPGGMDFINIAVPTSFLALVLELGNDEPAVWFRGAEPPTAMFSDDAFREMELRFRGVVESYTLRPRSFDAVELFGAVFRRWPTELDVEGAGAPDWLQRAVRVMSNEANLRDGMDRFRELAGVSQAHLSRSMRSHYGLSAVEWLARTRLRFGAVLLATSLDSVSEIAWRCGFDNSSYFGKRFRRQYGMPPAEFRRRRVAGVLAHEASDAHPIAAI